MADNLLYFTELVSMPVFDLKGRRIGRVKDAALVPLVHPSRIDRFLVGGADAWLTIRYDQVRSISARQRHLAQRRELVPYHDDEYMLRIAPRPARPADHRRQRPQSGPRQRRHLGDPARRRARHAERARSGYRRPQHLPPPASRACCRRAGSAGCSSRIPPNSIRWEFANVVEPDPQRRLRLNISYTKLEEMHPADLADIVEELGPAEREAIFETIDSEVGRRRALRGRVPKMQASILESLEPEKAADIVEEMSPDEAADILAELEEETSRGDPRRDGVRARRPRSANCSNSTRTPPAA